MLEHVPLILFLITFAAAVVLFINNRLQKLKIDKLSNIDPVTQVSNWPATLEQLEGAFLTAKRYHHPLTIALINLSGDSLRSEDAADHETNRVLRLVADELKSLLRVTDIIGRTEHNAFVIALTNTNSHDARPVFERIAETLRLLESEINFNIGSAHSSQQTESTKQLITLAQKALTQAKSKGENQVQYASDDISD